jgi:PhnB protein
MTTDTHRPGYPTPTPYLFVDDAAKAIEFYEKAFGARQRTRLEVPGGKIAHAELDVGDSLIMLCDPLPQFVSHPPTELGGTSAEVFMYVDDTDATVSRAVEAGATLTMEPADQIWGDRLGRITDPFGHVWLIATHLEDLTPEQIGERARAMGAA